MLVYRIRRKDTGQFWCGWRWDQNVEYWNDKGTMYRTIDNVKNHLDWLCSDTKIPYGSKRTMGFRKVRPKVVHQRMVRYEVVINDITINGERVVQATDFQKD